MLCTQCVAHVACGSIHHRRQWKIGMVSNCLHSAGIYQVMVFPDEMTEEIDPGAVRFDEELVDLMGKKQQIEGVQL